MQIKDIITKSSIIRRYTGLSIEKFYELVKKIRLLMVKEKKSRIYINKPGAGRRSNLTLEEQVAMVLIYYRTYCTQALLGDMAGIAQSNVSRILDKIGPFIATSADQSFLEKIEQNKVSIDSLTRNELQESYPELEYVLTDATEIEIQRPGKDNSTRLMYYSGKRKAFTVKFQVSVSKDQKFLDVTKGYPGSVHDKTIMDHEKTIAKFPKNACQLLDAGYQGVVNEYPDHYVNTPIKKPKNGELSPLEKECNAHIAKRRIYVENAIARIKKFSICSQMYRGKICKLNRIFHNVVILCNLMRTA